VGTCYTPAWSWVLKVGTEEIKGSSYICNFILFVQEIQAEPPTRIESCFPGLKLSECLRKQHHKNNYWWEQK
jgi:hypothetical protein